MSADGQAAFFWLKGIHYSLAIMMRLIAGMAFALAVNRLAFGRAATLILEDFALSENSGGATHA